MGAYEMGDCEAPEEGLCYIRADCNSDGEAGDIADAMFLLLHNFLGTVSPACLAACDSNADGSTTGVTDAIMMLSYLFRGGFAPPSPFPGCGPVFPSTDLELGCAAPPPACL